MKERFLMVKNKPSRDSRLRKASLLSNFLFKEHKWQAFSFGNVNLLFYNNKDVMYLTFFLTFKF